ncbi:gliding motility-associated C-terminal domain-containing protein [Mucilaginibacter jinjuensis]|uniref:Gliding motility-associated C-terminal domain-containing protein n=1 Tax=Mucilaginibacter jinjuensis TaxID=1176721 RepID=A0ABY7T6T9_9SPHI|nr:gliding motility-associated C-terminal domain-containing protein [Mucilaginibacter jinjuensis]WCT12215.1 gliding motility-associated C-terminal domain-containing protein [Mucilaginibacter jinjuensis]
MRQFASFLLIAAGLLSVRIANAQQCTGTLGGPVFSETFGHGTLYESGPQPQQLVTELTYFNATCGGGTGGVPNHPINGYYTLGSFLSETCNNGTWQVVNSDHTGDPHGYMMIITAKEYPPTLFTEKVSGDLLCPGTTYYMGAFIMNLLRGDLPGSQDATKPDVTFNVWNEDKTLLLGTGTTGPISADPGTGIWTPVSALFISPTDGKGVLIELVNNVVGEKVFHIALDDITIRPCGPTIKTGFGTINGPATENICEATNVNYILASQASGYSNPSYKWQYRNATYGDWQDVTTPGSNTANLPVNIINAAVGIYQYRVGVLGGATTNESCRIYSDPLTINVFPNPVIELDAVTGGCLGYPVQLSANVTTLYPPGLSLPDDPTFEWTGPNGFTSTDSSPFISYNGDPSINGTYTLKVTKNGCSNFAHTTVSVVLPAVINSTSVNNVNVCEGDATQLSVDASNATHYKWVPSTGLDHDDVANPIASPKETTIYEVTVSNDGCADVAPYTNITVNVLKKPQADAGQETRIFAGQNAKLNGTAQGDDVHYFWTPANYLSDPSSLTPIATPPQDITYTLHVASNTTCGESTSSVFVRVYQLLGIPNTFTPNGDGVNDKWEIKNISTYPNALVSIYNRNGQQVFQSRGYATAWDGTYNGSPLPTGTYYYVIDLQDGDLPKSSGWVLIVR